MGGATLAAYQKTIVKSTFEVAICNKKGSTHRMDGVDFGRFRNYLKCDVQQKREELQNGRS